MNNKGKLFTLMLSILLAAVIVYVGFVAASAEGDNRIFLESVFFLCVSSLFCAAYYRSNWLQLLSFIQWASETLSFPQKKIMSLVYSGIFFLYGGCLFYRWLFNV